MTITRRQKRLRRKAIAEEHALAVRDPKRPARGTGGRFSAPQEDAPKVALNTRCRHQGLAETREGRKTAADPLRGHALGLALLAVQEEDGKPRDWPRRLWACFVDWHAAEDRYGRLVLGRKSARPALAYIPDAPAETLEGTKDGRSEEERAEAARKAIRLWNDRLAALEPADHGWLMLAGLANTAPLVRLDAAEGMVATREGRLTVAALERLSEMAEAG